MDEDKSFKELLQKGLMETSSPGFTDKVMGQIQAINADKALNSLLITKRWKQLYKIAFAILSVAVVIMSFLVKPVQLNIEFLIDEQIIEKILMFIVSFWTVLLINHFIINKKIRKSFL